MEARLDQRHPTPRYPSIPWPAAASRSSAFGVTLARARRTARVKRAERSGSVPQRAVLGGPPPEVEAELDAAARLAQSLASQGRELRFATSETGHVSVELTDAAGHQLDTIGPAGLFQLLQQES